MKRVKQLLLKILNHKKCLFGKGSVINRTSAFTENNAIGRNSSFKNSFLGNSSYVGDNCRIDNTIIGNYSCISHCVVVVQGQHPINQYVSIHPAFYSKNYKKSFVSRDLFDDFKYIDKKRKVACIIGNDVWIGYGALILAGVKIGDGSIIAAGAVVTKDVEPYTIVGGVPAKLLKRRFDKETSDNLLNFKWWNKDKKWLTENAEKFSDIELFNTLLSKTKK